ncbi:MAG: TonB-dependent receptor [Desulfamplus sp.]|nr:TonB-dependent receptor [Desulfamplus sp.]
MIKKLFVLFVTWGVILFQTPVLAETNGLSDTRKTKDKAVATMDEVVVSVTQTETSVEKIGGNSVSVITAREIEEKNCQTVEEILKTVPGITIVSNGGMGTKSSVFMRGADSKNTLVLIDGIMVNDPSGANRDANLAGINLDNVERIEVVRGSMSVMYGSNATAGVINIITKKGKKEPEFTTTAEAGSYGTWKASGNALGATDKINYSVSASALSRDGFSVANKDNDKIPQSGNTDEDDGYKNLTLAGKFGVDINENFKITSSLRYMDAEVELDDYEGGYTGDNISSSWVEDPVSKKWVNTMVPNPDGPTDKKSESERIWGQVGINNTFAGGLIESIIAYKFSKNDQQSYDNNNKNWYDYKGDIDDVSWQGNINFETNTLSLGVGHFVEAMESKSSSVSPIDTRTISYWVQDQFFLGESFTLIAGVRLDDHESFGEKATFRIAPSYEIEKTATLLKASFGTGFRSPSLYELYSEYGNPMLDPEESMGWDIGLEQGVMNDTMRFGITYFEMDFNDRIGYDSLISKYNQLDGTTETSGVEVFTKWTPVEDFSCGISYTYTDAIDPKGKHLVRRPYNKASFNSSYRFMENAVANIDILWVDDRDESAYAMDKDGNRVMKLDAYTIVNLSASYDINKNIQIFTRVDNLFDTYYEEAFSYATAGLSGYMGLKLRW